MNYQINLYKFKLQDLIIAFVKAILDKRYYVKYI